MSGASGEERRSVRVLIAGEEYVLRTGEGESHTKRCAAMVDERMTQAASEGGGLDRSKVAVMAALLLADDLLKDRTKAAALAARLDEVLKGGVGAARDEGKTAAAPTSEDSA